MSASVRITHPFHPLFNQEIDVVHIRNGWRGETRVFYRDGDGHLASLPAHWTSVVSEDPYVAVGGSRSRFRAEDLVELVALIGGLQR